MAYFIIYLVQGLCIHTIGWKQGKKMDCYEEYFYHFHSEWILARGQLDLYYVGVIERIVFFTNHVSETKS